MKQLLLYMQHGVVRILLGLIEGYQFFISPILGANCRHLPTCSQYAKDAVIAHGPLLGSFFALRRILRCNPWVNPTLDPVPPVQNTQTSAGYEDSQNQRLVE